MTKTSVKCFPIGEVFFFARLTLVGGVPPAAASDSVTTLAAPLASILTSVSLSLAFALAMPFSSPPFTDVADLCNEEILVKVDRFNPFTYFS